MVQVIFGGLNINNSVLLVLLCTFISFWFWFCCLVFQVGKPQCSSRDRLNTHTKVNIKIDLPQTSMNSGLSLVLYVHSKFVWQEAVGIYHITWPAKKNCCPKFLHKFVCQKQPKTVQPVQPTSQSCKKMNFKWTYCRWPI
jgi:hypothetical protein